ncbi:MAG: sulfite exporter TauE/SafE family protein [Alphaproteobacteria bacterium]|nr:sulfite exporter TauE/SafE family protein [Alphaproteobacteria bacterium]
MVYDFLQPLLFFLAAAMGGAINAVAGGGSFLLFPVLMFGGLSPVAANVMCTIALWPGSVASSYAYWRRINTPVSTLKVLLFFCVIGSSIGAAALLHYPEETFAALVPWLLLFATLIFIFGRKMVALFRMKNATTPRAVIYFSMLAIAIYGGYFGAGIGILMLAMLQLSGHSDMHAMNGLKTVLGSAINAVAMVIFIVSGHVLWEWSLVLVAGGITGGYVGTRLALRVHPETVRRIVVAIACAMTAYFFTYG